MVQVTLIIVLCRVIFLAASMQDMPCVGPHKGRERQMFLGGTKVLASRGGVFQGNGWAGVAKKISKVIP